MTIAIYCSGELLLDVEGWLGAFGRSWAAATCHLQGTADALLAVLDVLAGGGFEEARAQETFCLSSLAPHLQPNKVLVCP